MSDIANEPKTSSSILTSKLHNGSGSDKGSGEGLDRHIEKKMWTKKRIIMAGAIVMFLAAIAYGYSTTTGGRKLNVDRDKITVATVVRAPFQENFAVTGNVLPKTTVYLDAVEGGRIEEIYVLEGTTVAKDQPLLRLSNNNLELSLINADAQRIEQIKLSSRLQILRGLYRFVEWHTPCLPPKKGKGAKGQRATRPLFAICHLPFAICHLLFAISHLPSERTDAYSETHPLHALNIPYR